MYAQVRLVSMLAVSVLVLACSSNSSGSGTAVWDRWVSAVMDESVLDSVPPGASDAGPLAVIDQCFSEIDSSHPEIRRELEFTDESAFESSVDWLVSEGWRMERSANQDEVTLLRRDHGGFTTGAAVHLEGSQRVTIVLAPVAPDVCNS